MQISHVIRGDDHINNTPKQIHVFNALSAPLPEFAHLPMINGPDGRKLSKRHGAVSVLEYKEQGFLPQALLNYLARLGWSHGDQELFSIDEMIEYFDISSINKSAASFDREKLLWTNQHHIKQASATQLADCLKDQYDMLGIDLEKGPDLIQIVEIYREKAKTLKEMAQLTEYLFSDDISYQQGFADKFLTLESLPVLEDCQQKITDLEQWQVDKLSNLVKNMVSSSGLKFPKVAQPLRVAVTGSTNSPSIDQTLWLLGKEKCLMRISKAINYIQSSQQ